MNVKNVIFDIDGTLWNSTGVVALGWQRAVDELGYSKAHIEAENLKKEFGLPMNIIADHIFYDVDEQSKKDELLELCCKYEHECLEANEEDISFEGIVDTIKALSENYRIFIVSNCQKGYIELVTAKLGIVEFIEDYLCFGDTGLTKGETMRILMDKNGLKAEETVYVGDTAGDKKATEDAEATFIYADYGFGELTDEKYVAYSPADIPEVIKGLSK